MSLKTCIARRALLRSPAKATANGFPVSSEVAYGSADPQRPPAKLPAPPKSASLLDVRALLYREFVFSSGLIPEVDFIASQVESGSLEVSKCDVGVLMHVRIHRKVKCRIGKEEVDSQVCCCLKVVPYLFRLALTDRQLYWRLAISLSFMIASKAAGIIDCRSMISSHRSSLLHSIVAYRILYASYTIS